MKTTNTIYTIVLGGLILAISSCKKMVQIEPPKNQIITANVFSDSANATSAVTGLYIRMNGNAFTVTTGNGGLTIYPGLCSDELNYSGSDPNQLEFSSNSINPNNGKNSDVFWKPAYSLIYQANACIEGLQQATQLSETYKNQLVGEAKLMRAFMFFIISNLYGDAPLTLTSDYKVNAAMSRTPVPSINQQIIADLNDARRLMSSDYSVPGRMRPNKFVASALLARVLLYNKQWSGAEAIASEIINSNTYSLVNLDGVFASGSKEAIWQLPYASAPFATTEGWQIYPGSPGMVPVYPLNNSLVNAFDSIDQRKARWTASNVVAGQRYFYPSKYKQRIDAGSPSKENYVVFRLAEQYLIRAEALAMQNKLPAALLDINTIRNRAGLSAVNFSSQNDVLSTIEHERQLELFSEWGHRWFDLKRTNRIDAVLGSLKPAQWKTTAQLFPIPSREIQLNAALSQNPGY